MRQGATAVWIADLLGPHWHAWSEGAQPTTEIAEVRQGIAHEGSAPKFCADTRLTAAARVRTEVFIFALMIPITTGTI
jgi:hypothetical protein